MVEILKAHGWVFSERKLCCGPARERWVKPGNYRLVITVLLNQYMYYVRQDGKTIKKDNQSTLNEYLKTLA